MSRTTSLQDKARRAAQAMDEFMSSFSTEMTHTQLRDAVPALRIFEAACRAKPDYELLVAHLADKRAAGDLVGSSSPADFVAEIFGVSYKKSWALIHQGNRMFNPPKPPSPPPPRPGASGCHQPGYAENSAGQRGDSADGSTSGLGSRQERESHTTGAANGGSGHADEPGPLGGHGFYAHNAGISGGPFDTEERERTRRYERELAAHKEIQSKLKKYPLGPDKQRAATYELAELSEDACPGYKEILSKTIDEARFRSVHDLRMWVRQQVARANRNSVDPLASYLKREFMVHQIDADGGARFSGYAPPAMLALLELVLRPACRPLHQQTDLSGNAPQPGGMDSSQPTGAATGQPGRDERTPRQRRCDAIFQALHRFASQDTAEHRGVGSIVVSMTADDVRDMARPGSDIAKRFATNTHARLNAYDLLVLGAAEIGFTTLHDRNGNPLAAGKHLRSADLMKRIALLASELVCSAPGCDEPAIFCDIHHINPWAGGGMTVIDNLTTMCRHHHMNNNDHRNPSLRRPYATKDPETGRTGHTMPPTASNPRPPTRFNDSTAANMSAGAYIRHREEYRRRTRENDPAGERERTRAREKRWHEVRPWPDWLTDATEGGTHGDGGVGVQNDPRSSQVSGGARGGQRDDHTPGKPVANSVEHATPTEGGPEAGAGNHARRANSAEPSVGVSKARDCYRSRPSFSGWGRDGWWSEDQAPLFPQPPRSKGSAA